MSSIFCLSGWGQKFDSIESFISLPKSSNYQITSIDYSIYRGYKDFIAKINFNSNPELIIGWSLGGQIALRLCADNILKPKKLILIAPPFQLVKNQKIEAGMTEKLYEEFLKNLENSVDETMKKFAILSIMNDKNKSEILDNLLIDNNNSQQLIIWLKELKEFSCFDLDFSKIPPTVYLMGKGDMIVHQLQVKYFEQRIKNFSVKYFDNCGHAPHISNSSLFNQILQEQLLSC